MRPVLAVQVCLALFQAFLLAPVQHVHGTPDGASAAGHEHATVIHSHFSPHAAAAVQYTGPAITDDDGQEIWPLDTFTIVLPKGTHAVVPGPAPEVGYTPRVVAGAAVAVEERAHDPPDREASIPRAPPA